MVSIEQCLPESFDNVITAQGVDRGVWRMILRTNVSSRDEIYQWKAELERNTQTDYNYRWVKQLPDKYVWQGRFLCSRTDQGKQVKSDEERARTRPDLFKATGCRHAFNVKIDHPDKTMYAALDPQRAHYVEQGYLCEIIITDVHNHTTDDWISSNHLKAQDEARLQIAELLKSGMSPRDAMRYMATVSDGDQIASNRYQPKPHVYYEIARVLRTQQQMRDQHKLPAGQSSVGDAKVSGHMSSSPVKVPMRVLKRAYVPNEVNEVLVDGDDDDEGDDDKDEPIEQKMHKLDDVSGDIKLSPAVGTSADSDDMRQMFTIPPAPGRPPVPQVSVDQGAALVRRIGDTLTRLYARHCRCVHVRAAVADMCTRLLAVHTRQQLAQFMRNAAVEVTFRNRGQSASGGSAVPFDVKDRLRFVHSIGDAGGSAASTLMPTYMTADGHAIQYIESISYDSNGNEDEMLVAGEQCSTGEQQQVEYIVEDDAQQSAETRDAVIRVD